jgi:hypothetical protein
MRNIHSIKANREPVKGDILLRHIWKNNPNECISWWRYKETIDIDTVKQYTTLNGSFRDMYQSFEVRNLYITINGSFSRDEYVTDGIEVIKATPKLVDAQGYMGRRQWKKIVLTTDPDLIAERVKSASDEFLDWFVKNPNCETVVVRQRPKVNAIVKGKGIGYFANGYDIIIPKKFVQIDQDNPVTMGSTALVYKQENLQKQEPIPELVSIPMMVSMGGKEWKRRNVIALSEGIYVTLNNIKTDADTDEEFRSIDYWKFAKPI